jgi:hypothetical protein
MATTGTMLTLVVSLTWTCVDRTSGILKNKVFAILMATQGLLEDLIHEADIQFAPTLGEIMKAVKPPSLAQLKALPATFRHRWGVYLLTMEKCEHRPKVYIGSGTAFQYGVHSRMLQYDRNDNVGAKVRKALNDGFVITSKGLLCWIPIPGAGKLYLYRVLFYALESMFASYFWVMASRTKDYGIPNLCPWPFEALDWDGLCTHTSLQDPIYGEADGLTPEQIAEKEYLQLTAFRDVRNARTKACKQNAIKNRTYSCDTCGVVTYSQWDLNNHNDTRRHKDKVNGITRVLVNKKQMGWQKQNRVMKRYYCRTCDRAFGCQQQLTNHKGTQGHQKKVLESKDTSKSSSRSA